MKLLNVLILSLLVSTILSQESKDFIIKLNKDTVFTKIVRIDKELKSVICEEKGKKTKYEAKDILALKYDTVFYEVGLIRLKRHGSEQYLLLQRIVNGDLSLYEINVKKTKFLWKTFGEDVVHLRWVFRAHAWTKGVLNPVDFYKRKNESRESFTKDWKEKTKDCKAMQEKFDPKVKLNLSPIEIVQFYNTNCR